MYLSYHRDRYFRIIFECIEICERSANSLQESLLTIITHDNTTIIGLAVYSNTTMPTPSSLTFYYLVGAYNDDSILCLHHRGTTITQVSVLFIR
jgi:hypothetical protein